MTPEDYIVLSGAPAECLWRIGTTQVFFTKDLVDTPQIPAPSFGDWLRTAEGLLQTRWFFNGTCFHQPLAADEWTGTLSAGWPT